MDKATNFYLEDQHLQELVRQYLEGDMLGWAQEELTNFGKLCATDIDERAAHTDREGQPRLIKYNRFGVDISEVWVNEGYKKTIQDTYNRGIVGYIHKEIPELGRHGGYWYSFAQGYLLSQTEPGFYCPVTLTMATAYLLERYASDEIKTRFLPHVLSTGETELYEGATFLTERQGGSDVGANETQAVKIGETYHLYGEKYFASNSGMCGVAMVLARIDRGNQGTKGLSLFAVPWRTSGGDLNGIHIRRLKDKLGVRAVPSAEVEFYGAKAYLVGEESKGIHYMMEALNLSRLCNAIASIGIMRRAYIEARNYAFYREAFGKKLADYPMIQETLTNMGVKQEVETSAVFHLAALFDQAMSIDQQSTEQELVMNRLLIALLKKETAEQSIHFAHEAIEIHGGNGYIEDFVLPRLLRDAQVLTVWEGTANILGLEILRLMKKYQAHVIFIDNMTQELTHLAKKLDQFKKPIMGGIKELEVVTRYILKADDAVQTYHAKKVAKLMVDIFESVIALKGVRDKDNRSLAVAEIFIDLVWEGKKHLDLDMKSVIHFDNIVRSQTTGSNTV